MLGDGLHKICNIVFISAWRMVRMVSITRRQHVSILSHTGTTQLCLPFPAYKPPKQRNSQIKLFLPHQFHHILNPSSSSPRLGSPQVTTSSSSTAAKAQLVPTTHRTARSADGADSSDGAQPPQAASPQQRSDPSQRSAVKARPLGTTWCTWQVPGFWWPKSWDL